MKPELQRMVDRTIDALKKEGCMTLMLIFDEGSDETKKMGMAVEVLCSETNDPKLLAAMAKTALEEMKPPESFAGVGDRQKLKLLVQ